MSEEILADGNAPQSEPANVRLVVENQRIILSGQCSGNRFAVDFNVGLGIVSVRAFLEAGPGPAFLFPS